MELLDNQRNRSVKYRTYKATFHASAAPKSFLNAAWASYKDFQTLNAAIVELSRRNSNIRSFALSLGQKRKMTAQCQDGLTALQETVRESMSYKTTR
jgi:hypothetical protein